MPSAEFFAGLCHVQLQIDRAAMAETRSVFSSKAAVQHLIEESSLTFAPGLAGMIQSPKAPSVQQLRACSITLTEDDLRSKWVVYLQYYRKGSHWYVYCGKSTSLRGALDRMRDYVKNRNSIPQSIRDLVETGVQHMGHTILAAVDIPFDGADRIYTEALITILEATFAAGFWAYAPLTLGSVTPLRFWEEMPWSGLCSHSALMEIGFADLKDDLPNLDEIRHARIERLNLNSNKYRSTEKGRVAMEKYKNSLIEAYRTDAEFREKRLQYRRQYTADGKNAPVRAKYKASEKYKITEAAYKASGALARAKSRYAKSDKNKAAQAKYLATEKGKAAAKRKQDKYRAKKKLAKMQASQPSESVSEQIGTGEIHG